MILPVVFWFAQNFLVVLSSGAVRVPEIFLLSLVYRLLTEGRDVNVPTIWAAFLGGLVWDLRWIRIPGFFTLIYVAVVIAVIWVWNTLPLSGKTPSVIFCLFWMAQLLPPALFLLILGRNTGDARLELFLVQQGYAMLLSLFCTFVCVYRQKAGNA